MNKLKNVLIIMFSVFSLPLIYFFAEYKEIKWLQIVVAVALIPYMIWWGFFGYNKFLGAPDKDKETEETEED